MRELSKRFVWLLYTLTFVALLAGCATTHPPAATPAAVPAEPPPAQRDLDQGIALYDQGDFSGAITKLNSVTDAPTATVTMQTTALKYLAFSYCITNRAQLCRAQFEKALTLNSNFDLEPGEKGHPLWGPVFDRVKKAHATPKAAY